MNALESHLFRERCDLVDTLRKNGPCRFPMRQSVERWNAKLAPARGLLPSYSLGLRLDLRKIRLANPPRRA